MKLNSSLLSVRKRDGREADFEIDRIRAAITAAFCAELEIPAGRPLAEPTAAHIQALVLRVQEQVLIAAGENGTVDVESIQDIVENQLMRAGHFNIARRYILYRHQRARMRALRLEAEQGKQTAIRIRQADGSLVPLEISSLKIDIYSACQDCAGCDPELLLRETLISLYDGMTAAELAAAAILVARSRIERHPVHDRVATRLLLAGIYDQAIGGGMGRRRSTEEIRTGFHGYVQAGQAGGLLAPALLTFDLHALAAALIPDRDDTLTYPGLQTLYDRYLLKISGRRIETPQYFWMRVAMGLAMDEGAQRNSRAIEFYEALSTFRFISATPTLFNSGTRHPQLSSCYLTTVADDLAGIFKAIGDNAMLSKWAGGLGNDWTRVRATGATIRGTNGESQGVVPFLKIVSDTAVAVNQGGKRKGAACAYLETWHLDVEDFLDLRKNTGDDRRRTHDLHTANWIPDLFMQRVAANEKWTLFSPHEVPDLHDLYGKAFANRYAEYERLARDGAIRQFRTIEARDLWRKMLSMVFETGHPWMTFKDPSNIRSPQDHAGVVHSSNLCTEILLNTSETETAVCNLGSLNLAAHVTESGVDEPALARTIATAVRMLDNVIDINFYPTPEARDANLRHRPVGLGIMGFQDALFVHRIAYDSDAAVDFADKNMEFISYHAILASSSLAQERGVYRSYRGSKWDRGLLPLDTLELLESQRGESIDVDRTSTMDWSLVRRQVAAHGMRNSNVMAIAPTATISNIAGVAQSIEPAYRNLFAKSNLSGDFAWINRRLVADLEALGLWDDRMIDDLKHFDGSVQSIDRIPESLRRLYRTAFEIEPRWIIEAAARRQKWIDMGQSLNLYLDQPSGRRLEEMYFLAWRKGLKTTYYLRSQAATQVEKSSVDINAHGIQPRWMKHASASAEVVIDRSAEAPASCGLNNPSCEACQ